MVFDYCLYIRETFATNILNLSANSKISTSSFCNGRKYLQLIEYNPVLSEQTSPFEVITTDNPAIARYQISFKFLLGNTIPTEDLR